MHNLYLYSKLIKSYFGRNVADHFKHIHDFPCYGKNFTTRVNHRPDEEDDDKDEQDTQICNTIEENDNL